MAVHHAAIRLRLAPRGRAGHEIVALVVLQQLLPHLLRRGVLTEVVSEDLVALAFVVEVSSDRLHGLTR